MFETADIAHEIDKEAWKQKEPELREQLLAAQMELLRQKRFPVLIVIAGVEGAGKSETVHLLNEWMDPRHILTHGFDAEADEERERPYLYRFWQRLPPKGRIGIFVGAWHSRHILDRAFGRSSGAEFDGAIAGVQRFEKMLTDEGVLLVKFWFHLTREQQKKRLRDLESKKATRWRVGPGEWDLFDRYDDLAKASEHYIRKTSTAQAPWYVVNGSDPRYRAMTVGTTLLGTMRTRLEVKSGPVAPEPPPLVPSVDGNNVIRSLQLARPMAEDEYARLLEKWQGRLNLLSREPAFRRMSVVAVFEGNDAAGKGGAIRRVTAAIDARRIRPVPVAAPTDEERAQPYLWRFWRQLPHRGRIAIFDRSWYGRVLVERVEGFCPEEAWMRAYGEINDFEVALVSARTVLVKFWLAISKEEQLRRFQEREEIPHKRFKITDEDWRNREKWDAYEQSVCDMVDRTSTEEAPWTLVEADNKLHARIKVLKTLCRAIERGIKHAG
ncbi:MAG TPA: polyphosphate:AMP phosphotransferase [Candidatus Binatia bacterium]